LFLSAKWALLPFDLVQFQLMLHTIELLLKLELVQLLLCFVQLLRAWLCCRTGAIYCLLPKQVKLPLRLTEFLAAIEIIKLFALVEFVDLFLLGRLRPLLSERVCRRPAGGRRQKKSGQQQTYSNEPEQFHRHTSFALWSPPLSSKTHSSASVISPRDPDVHTHKDIVNPQLV
jgi:hypothetical protein